MTECLWYEFDKFRKIQVWEHNLDVLTTSILLSGIGAILCTGSSFKAKLLNLCQLTHVQAEERLSIHLLFVDLAAHRVACLQDFF